MPQITESYPTLALDQLHPVVSDVVRYRSVHFRTLDDGTELTQMTHESIAAGNDIITFRRLRGEPVDGPAPASFGSKPGRRLSGVAGQRELQRESFDLFAYPR